MVGNCQVSGHQRYCRRWQDVL